jgi:hypothetical protein
MQTFIPVATYQYDKMAQYLDNKRLNKQALEGWQILMTLVELDPQGNDRKPKGWVNHPAVKMWRGHEYQLYKYILAMTKEWKNRGFNTTIDSKAMATFATAVEKGKLSGLNKYPTWMSDNAFFEQIAASHRVALLAKEYGHYHQFNWEEDKGQPDTYEYIWPV